jgi:cyclase
MTMPPPESSVHGTAVRAPELPRRQFLRALLSGAAGLTLAWPAAGQGRGPAPITALKLTERLVAFSGNGGNVVMLIGSDGLLLIDGGLVGRGPDMAKAVADVSPRLVQVLFNTHYHFDHVGSNELAGMAGARIVAHENVAARVRTTFENAAMGRTMEALKPVGYPTQTFTSGGMITFGGETLEYTHEPLAHTDGDAYVFVSSANVLHTGDLFWYGRYPVVDYSVGGSLARMAAALDRLERIGDERTRIIPGHGKVDVTKADLRQARDRWLTINRKLEDYAREGRSADEVVGAAPTKEFDAAVGVQNPEPFVRQAFAGVLARQR